MKALLTQEVKKTIALPVFTFSTRRPRWSSLSCPPLSSATRVQDILSHSLLEGEQKTLTRLSGQTSMLIKLRIHHRVTGGRQGIEVSSMMCKQRISLVQPPLTRPYILPLMLVFALSTAALCHSRLSLLLNSSVLLICCEYVGMRFEHLCGSYHAWHQELTERCSNTPTHKQIKQTRK